MAKGHAGKVQESVIELLIAERKRRGLSHEKLAKAAGIHRTAISHIENRRRNPTLLLCLKLAEALGCSFADLLTKAERKKSKY